MNNFALIVDPVTVDLESMPIPSRLGQAQFAGEAILEHPPKPLDAAFGLRAVGGQEGDAELFQCATEVRGLAFSSELFSGTEVRRL